LISFVTPGPQFGGEPLQVYWLWKRYAVAGPAAVMAVGLDRFFEFWVNFGVLLIAVLALLASATAVEVQWLTIAASLAGLMLAMGGAAWVSTAPTRQHSWLCQTSHGPLATASTTTPAGRALVGA
jgi:hypothetical protein